MRSDSSDFPARIRHIRGARSQESFAGQLQIGVSSLRNYEAGLRLPPAEVFTQLANQGWNANWLLTGEGPERFDALAPQEQDALTIALRLPGWEEADKRRDMQIKALGAGIRLASPSQVVSAEDLSIALELIDERLRQLDVWLPRRDYAELLLIILEMRRENLAFSRIRTAVDVELKRLSQQGADANAGRVGLDGESEVSAGESGAEVKPKA